ncbi:MAG TPA: HEAT repeat domain-containing protein, partial [Methylomirabilota bacterium]
RSLAQLKAKEAVGGCCLLAVTPADDLAGRAADPFCGSGVLGAINELADFSHSKAIADLISDGNAAKDRLILTLGRIGPPRYANFIGRWRDDADPEIRRSVASALGSLDNPGVTIPVLVQLLARGTAADAFGVKWEASESLVRIAKRPGGDAVRPRLVALLGEPDGVTAALAARTLAAAGDARGVTKLRELAGHADARARQEAVLALGALPDRGGADGARRRLKDDNLAVRATAIYALGRIAGAAAAAELRAAGQDALAYETQLEAKRRSAGESEETLRQRYGLGVFDLRETLQQALTP